MKRFYFLAAIALTLLTGFLLGAVVQREIGIGNLLRGAGLPYPTQTPGGPPPTQPTTLEIPASQQGQMALFILAGQSNMVGWAPIPETQEIDANIYVFGNDYRWRVAAEPVDDPAGQVDPVSLDRAAAFGPSLAFASAIRSQQPEMVIGLIPCAKSASAIIEWQRNLSDQSLYGACLKRAQAASPMGYFAGILFFQGETDAVDATLYPQFKPNPAQWSALFTLCVDAWREDLRDPRLPVVFAQIGANSNPGEGSKWELVQEQQRAVDLPGVAMITTSDLATLDGLHFTTESYRMVGERFAAAYLALMQQEDTR
jgi:hypothetical protein